MRSSSALDARLFQPLPAQQPPTAARAVVWRVQASVRRFASLLALPENELLWVNSEVTFSYIELFRESVNVAAQARVLVAHLDI